MPQMFTSPPSLPGPGGGQDLGKGPRGGTRPVEHGEGTELRSWQLGKPPSRAPGDTGPPWARLPRGKVPGGGRGSRPSSPNRGPRLGSVLGRQGGLIPAPRWVSPLPRLAPPLLCAQTIQCRSNHPGQQTRRCACSCSNPHSRPGSRLTALRTRRATDAACPWSSCGPARGREAARRLPH